VSRLSPHSGDCLPRDPGVNFEHSGPSRHQFFTVVECDDCGPYHAEE
jgi:hypothetical protein